MPPEVAHKLAIDQTTIYNECDLWVDKLFDFSHPDLSDMRRQFGVGNPLAVVSQEIARVHVDVNRRPDDLSSGRGQ